MAVLDRDSFGYLGYDYQIRLIAQFITDRKFSESILDIVDPNYFADSYLKIIVATIKDAHRIDNIVPDIGSLQFRLLEEVKDDIQQKYVIAQLRKIQEADLNDTLKVQDMAMRFCKQQDMLKTLVNVEKLNKSGGLDNFDQIEAMLRKSLEVGDNKDQGMSVYDNISSVLDVDFRKPIPTGISGLDEIMDGGLSKGELGVILAPFGVGKAQGVSSKIYTPSGYCLMGDIKVGDRVINRLGRQTNVTGVYPQGIRPIYQVKFNDGTSTMCDKEHLWSVNQQTKLDPNDDFTVMKTSDIIEKLNSDPKGEFNYKIPTVKPVIFDEKELPLNPYLLGLLIGDEYFKSSIIVTKDFELIEYIKQSMSGDSTYGVEMYKDDVIVTINQITDVIKKLGLFDSSSNNKFIPKEYLYNSINNRQEILQGLLDNDGSVGKDGSVGYNTVSKQLCDDVKELVLSLGGSCLVSNKVGELTYRLVISFPKENGVVPFKLNSKLVRVVNNDNHSDNKFIESIEYSHDEEAKCIMVDDPEHLYVTDDFIVTHNTTMMTKIANTGANDGYNVLQIFFEDNPKVIQRKHLSCWTGIPLNDLSSHHDEVMTIVAEKQKLGDLRLVKFSSDGTTIPMIRQYIRKLIAQGFRPDLILLDYIDCVEPSRKFDDINAGEGSVMRQFETLLSELDMAGWTAVQGNRCVRIDTEVQIIRLGKTEIKNVIEGDEILTNDGYKKITTVFPIEKQPVYKIKLKSGKEIFVSSKHEFPVKCGKLRSISTGLSVGDKLLTKK